MGEPGTVASGRGAAAATFIGLVCLLIGFFGVPILFLAGLAFAFIGVVLHILSPHHTHVTSDAPRPCPACGTLLTYRDDMTGMGWWCAKEQAFVRGQ